MANDARPALAPDAVRLPPERAGDLTKAALVLVAVGAALTTAALATESGRSTMPHAWLVAFAFVWAIVLGSLFFVALQHLTRSVWSVVVRRVAEAIAWPMGTVAVLFLGVLGSTILAGTTPLFHWPAPADAHPNPFKEAYLDPTFFAARAGFFFLFWIACTRFFVRGSLGLAGAADPEGGAARMRALAGPFMPAFALTATFAAIDWLMSLDPTWHSTIFGVYVFSGMVGAALGAITLLALWLRRCGHLGDGLVTDDHVYSLGALLFAFSCFWAYIAFSQFMLIWYGNLPEETAWFVRRTQTGWLGVSILLPGVRFLLPFALLLSRPAKMDPKRLAAAAGVVIAGELLDIYWIVMPERYPDGPVFDWREAGPLLVAAGAFLGSIARFLRRHPAVALGDPMLEESLRFRL